jgi:tetratricopeptide (TPR) repeat protein
MSPPTPPDRADSVDAAADLPSNQESPLNEPAADESSHTEPLSPEHSTGEPNPVGVSHGAESPDTPVTFSTANPAAATPTPLLPRQTMIGQGPSTADDSRTDPDPFAAKTTLKATPPSQKFIAGYEVLEVLGRGGMGVVYKARQPGLNRVVALKMILAGSHAGPEELDRFRSEAEAVALFQHPNIVQIYEVGEHEGLPFFSLEFVDGGSLHKHLKETPQPAAVAARLAETLARAMHAAHERGIIHRDLKPANILLQKSEIRNPKSEIGGASDFGFRISDFSPKISDFGLAKRIDQPSGQTRSGNLMGTPSYMAPEQAQGKVREVGPPADIYALGAILYEMLTGRPPFKGETVFDTVDQVCTQEPVPPSQLQPKVPRDLETICLKCLQKEQHKRYSTALALAEDLHRLLNGEPITARRIGRGERALKWARRRPAAAALIVCSLVAVASLAAAHYMNLRENQRKTEVRADCQNFLLQAHRDGENQQWEQAAANSSNALVMIEHEPSLDDLRDDARRLHAEAQRMIKAAQAQTEARLARQRSLARYQEFFRLLSQAQFHLHQGVVAGADAEVGPKVSQENARAALDLLEVNTDGPAAPVLDAYEPDEQEKLRQGCYQALLLLAEATAMPRSGQATQEQKVRAALRLLDQAEPLGCQTCSELRRRARYLTLLGDKDGARQMQERADKLQPATALDWFLLGYDAWVAGKRPEARKYFNDALRKQPDHFWALFFHAVSEYQDGNALAARADLTVCCNLQPDFVWSYVLRGFINGEMRDRGSAEEDFAQALALLGQHPDRQAQYVTLVNRGVVRIRTAQAAQAFDQAMDDFRQAIQLRPEHYHAVMNLGLAYKKLRKWDAALEQLTKAIALYPKAAQANRPDATLALLYREAADTQRERNDMPAALRGFATAAQWEAPGSKELAADYLERALILYRQGSYVEAEQACAAALLVNDSAPVAYRIRGELLAKLGGDAEAARSFEHYLELARNQQPAAGRKSLADVFQAHALTSIRLGKHAEAIEDYTQALALQPKNARLLTSRGWEYLLSDAPKLALRDFEAALKLDKASPDAYNGRGCARIKLGQYAKAVQDAEEAVRLGKQTPRTLHGAARIFAQVVNRMDTDPNQRNLAALETRSAYQDRALTLLREALAQTPAAERAAFWRAYVKPDSSFDAVRRSTTYARLALEYSGVHP